MSAGPFQIIRLNEVDSTNDFLSARKKHIKQPVCITAAYQNKGRGQGENVWQSERNMNLLASFAFQPENLQPSESFHISRVASLAIIDFLEPLLPGVMIKWPNDIIYGKYKLAGILIENTFSGNNVNTSIVGMGINLNQQKFSKMPSETTPASVKSLSGSQQDISMALKLVSEKLMEWIHVLNAAKYSSIINAYNRKLFRFSEYGMFREREKVFEAKLVDILDDGRMQLETQTGESRYYAFKEVSFVL
jgi:BirA family biotin operon repressor/biotin-[acetyl-CoA-carboxylase] ligase